MRIEALRAEQKIVLQISSEIVLKGVLCSNMLVALASVLNIFEQFLLGKIIVIAKISNTNRKKTFV